MAMFVYTITIVMSSSVVRVGGAAIARTATTTRSTPLITVTISNVQLHRTWLTDRIRTHPIL